MTIQEEKAEKINMSQIRVKYSGCFIFAAEAPLEFCVDNPQLCTIYCENRKWFVINRALLGDTRVVTACRGSLTASGLQPQKHKWAPTEEQKRKQQLLSMDELFWLTCSPAASWKNSLDILQDGALAGWLWPGLISQEGMVKKNVSLTLTQTFWNSVCLWTRSE